MAAIVDNLNSLLGAIHARYTTINREDLKLKYRVFEEVFPFLKTMWSQNEHINKDQFAESPYKRLRIIGPNTFELGIIFNFPICMYVDPSSPKESDIFVEQIHPRFVQLRTGTLDYLPFPVDKEQYVCYSAITTWFEKICTNLNTRRLTIEGIDYNIHGTAVSIKINNGRTPYDTHFKSMRIESSGFCLRLNLEPLLRIPKDQRLWKRPYRAIPVECREEYWLVHKSYSKIDEKIPEALNNRSWCISLHDQEEQLLSDKKQLQQVFELLKKLVDAQDMEAIDYYVIKTLFLWEVIDKKNTDPYFWQKNLATLLTHMLYKFYEALDEGHMSYFWNRTNNIINNINTRVLNKYKNKVNALLTALQDPPDYKSVAKFLLTCEEYQECEKSNVIVIM